MIIIIINTKDQVYERPALFFSFIKITHPTRNDLATNHMAARSSVCTKTLAVAETITQAARSNNNFAQIKFFPNTLWTPGNKCGPIQLNLCSQPTRYEQKRWPPSRTPRPVLILYGTRRLSCFQNVTYLIPTNFIASSVNAFRIFLPYNKLKFV